MTSAAATNPGFGVSTSPSADELKRFAMLVLDNVELDPRSFGVNRINRLAVRFTQRMPNATFWAFFLYLTNDVLRLSEKQRQSALLEYPAIYRIVSLQRGRRRLRYADPIGEDAVWNVANPSKPPKQEGRLSDKTALFCERPTEGEGSSCSRIQPSIHPGSVQGVTR